MAGKERHDSLQGGPEASDAERAGRLIEEARNEVERLEEGDSEVTARNDPLSRLADLAAGVDGDFAEIRHRQGARMQCRSGCSSCCRSRLSITRVEETFLRRGLASMPETTRAEMAERTRDATREMCPALDSDGRCQVYEHRPLICRSFGVPQRRRREVPLVNPPVIDVCDLNFVGTRLHTLPSEDVLDQTSLDAVVAEIDDDYCAANDLPRGERIPIAHILATSGSTTTRT